MPSRLSPIPTSPSASATLLALTNFLVSPLTTMSSFIHVAAIHQALLAHLPSPTFTFILSPTALPPMPILAVCTAWGINWIEWFGALSQSVGVHGTIHVFVEDGKIRIGDGQSLKDVWTEKLVSISRLAMVNNSNKGTSEMEKKLNALLDSVRSRKEETHPISLPTLPTLSSDEESDDDNDSDSEASSYHSSVFSAPSSDVESVSSAASSPEMVNCKLEDEDMPYIPPSTPSPAPVARNVPLYRSPRKSSPVTRTPSTTSNKPADQDSKMKYLYSGGETRVMSGGVRLGVSSSVLLAPEPSRPRKAKKSGVEGNWRARKAAA